MKVLIILSYFLVVTYALQVKNCGSSNAPKEVKIDGCEKMPCKFKKGAELSAKLIFTTSASTNTLKPKLTAKVFGMNMNIDIPKEQQNACAYLENLKCPLQQNQDVIYTAKMPIAKSTPTIKTEIEVNLIGDNNKSHVCFKIDSEIVNG